MTKDQILSDLNKNKQLFTLPQMLNEMLKTMEDEDSSLSDIANVIMKDPIITAKVLKIANSSFYKRTNEISTVNQAVMVLGGNAIKSVALSVSILNLVGFQNKSKNQFRDPRAYWKHSLETGVCGRLLAKECDYPEPEEALVAGLLHDIGILFLEAMYPEMYEKVVEKLKEGKDLITSEKEVFGLDHSELGGIIAKQWNIPAKFTLAITSHHNSEEFYKSGKFDKLSTIISLAHCLTRNDIEYYSQNLESKVISIDVISTALGIGREQLEKIRNQTSEETIEAAANFDIDTGDVIDLLKQANAELGELYFTAESLFRERQELSGMLLKEERRSGAIESLNIAVSTLAHYINNASMAVSGRSQLLRMILNSGQIKDYKESLKKSLDVIDSSVIKIGATIEELKEFTDLENAKYYNHSQALNIEEQLKKRIKETVEKKKQEVTS